MSARTCDFLLSLSLNRIDCHDIIKMMIKKRQLFYQISVFFLYYTGITWSGLDIVSMVYILK